VKAVPLQFHLSKFTFKFFHTQENEANCIFTEIYVHNRPCSLKLISYPYKSATACAEKHVVNLNSYLTTIDIKLVALLSNI